MSKGNTSLDGLRSMLRIRMVEEAIVAHYPAQEMRCPVHLSIGQECTPVAVSAHLRHEDQVFSGHRCHAHYIAKGGDLRQMIAELYGRVTGCARGRGGSMHLVDYKVGMMGSSALVAGTIPIAVGAGLAFSQEGSDKVAVAYFGDGASEEGLFYESLNIASLKKLPVLFVCENNLYATFSHQKARQARGGIHNRGESLGVPGFLVDGNNYEEAHKVCGEAVARARSGNGPTLFEFTTYRHLDHVGHEDGSSVGYRTAEEVSDWKAKDPIVRLTKDLLSQNTIDEKWLSQVREEIRLEIEDAFAFAKSSPYPEPSEIFADVY
jgi:acetoin:2,6-dichlorophenolindophenol oxidoreductase subunit alpha